MNYMTRLVCLVFLLFVSAELKADGYPWLTDARAHDSLLKGFETPRHFERVLVPPSSFAAFMRSLPLKSADADLKTFDGRVLTRHFAAAIVDLDIGSKDLQQCADTLIRLYAEYAFSKAETGNLVFKFTSGDPFAYRNYLQGKRPVVRGNKVAWKQTPAQKHTRQSFSKWLDIIFTYAGTASLARDLKAVSFSNAQIGDLFITAGFPGHTVMIADMAVNAAGVRRVLLVQGYTPAQSAHIVFNRNEGSAWHILEQDKPLNIGFWQFEVSSLRRFFD
ncbi:MAG: hypothetical protein JKY60_04800 [Kordiimonadaceae bacterium]|nr:hypothetical protein [Kordiimonadaceae bacterium]